MSVEKRSKASTHAVKFFQMSCKHVSCSLDDESNPSMSLMAPSIDSWQKSFTFSSEGVRSKTEVSPGGGAGAGAGAGSAPLAPAPPAAAAGVGGGPSYCFGGGQGQACGGGGGGGGAGEGTGPGWAIEPAEVDEQASTTCLFE